MIKYTVEDILTLMTVNEDGMTRVWYDGYETDKKIERLREALKEIFDYAKRMDGYYAVEALNKVVQKIMGMIQQTVKEE